MKQKTIPPPPPFKLNGRSLTLPGQTATSVFENCPVIHCVYRFVMVVRKNVLEYIIALVVVKNKVRLKKCLKKFQI